MSPYIYERILALDGGLEVRLGELNIEVAALVLCVDRDGHVHVLDGLRPLVGQRGLFSILLRFEGSIGLLLLLGGG